MTYKALVIPDHAFDRLQGRTFTRHDVRTVLAVGRRVPLTLRPATANRLAKQALIRGERLTVIYLENAHEIEVVTLHAGPPRNLP